MEKCGLLDGLQLRYGAGAKVKEEPAILP